MVAKFLRASWPRRWAATESQLALRPRSPAVRNNLGIALFSQGKLTEAIEEYRQAIHLQPDLAVGHNNLGFALSEQGKLAEAIEELHRSLNTNPTSPSPTTAWHQRQ